MKLISIKTLFSLKSLRKKLFFNMLGLAALTMLISFSGLFFSFKYAENRTVNSVNTLMDIYELQLKLHFETLSGIGDGTAVESRVIIEEFLSDENLSFDDLKMSKESMEKLKKRLSFALKPEMFRNECSAFFIILNTSLENKEFFYKSSENAYQTEDSISNSILKTDFDERIFDEFKAGDKTRELIISDKNVFLLWKIYGNDGKIYGICGYEIDESFFQDKYIQNTDLKSYTILLFSKNALNETGEQDISPAIDLKSGKESYNDRNMNFISQKISKNLYSYKGNNIDNVGNSKDISLFDKSGSCRLYVMIGRKEYKAETCRNIIKISALLCLIILFIIISSFFLSNSCIKELLISIERFKKGQSEEENENLPQEIKDFFAFLKTENEKKQKAYSEEILALKQEVKRLEYDRKKEIDPDNFKSFLEGISTLTKTEKKIFDLYRKGHTAKEILEIANIKESTLRYHNQNIYSKLSVNSMKLMLRYCTLMQNNSKTEL